MPFEIVRNDITKMKTDAIVNTANPEPIVGAGVDSAVHRAAGPELLKARQKIGSIPVGEARLTPAYGLPARYVIHTAGPVWNGGTCGETELLARCYEASLQLAAEKNCRSIAIPLISSGSYRFPRELALQTAVSSISSFLLRNEMTVCLTVLDRRSFVLSEQLFQSVRAYIDGVCAEKLLEYEYQENVGSRRYCGSSVCRVPDDRAERRKLEDLMKEMDDTFSEAVMQWIIRKDLKESDVYKRANLDRRLFSKIRSNPDYRPSKLTAIALGIALELNQDELKDLIGRAGYALTHSSRTDIIVEYFVSRGMYDIFEINEVLFAFGQPLIGG